MVRVAPVRVAGVILVSWDQQFFDPIPLPSRKPLVTLREAAECIIKLPKAENDTEEWQAALQALLLVAEHDGPIYVCTDRYHASLEPPRRTGVRPITERQALGKTEPETRRVTNSKLPPKCATPPSGI
jgi:hypothetical protein